MVTVYGIKNCDTVKKARVWLEQHHIVYQFYDYKAEGVNQALLNEFSQRFGWENLLNKRSTTWRQLADSQKEGLTSETALQLLLEYPTLIKRPILITGDIFIIGFDADEYQAKL